MEEVIIRHSEFPEYAFLKPTEALKEQLDIAFKDNQYCTKWPTFRDRANDLYILCHFDKPVGYLVLYPEEHRYRHRPEVYFGQMFAIVPKLRNKGYGKIFSQLIDEYILSLKGKVVYGHAVGPKAADFWRNRGGYLYAIDELRPSEQPTVYRILVPHNPESLSDELPSRLEIWFRRNYVPKTDENFPDAVYDLSVNLKKKPIIAFCPGDYHMRFVINNEYVTPLVKCKYLNRYITNAYEVYPFLILNKLEFKHRDTKEGTGPSDPLWL